MHRLNVALCAAIAVCLSATLAHSQAKCPSDKLVIGTGTDAGTYAQLFKDVVAKCSMICEEKKTQGGYDNLVQILDRKFDGGIVQVDTLDLVNINTKGAVERNIRSLFPLHTSSLHIVVMRDGLKTVTQKTRIETQSAWGGLSTKAVEVPYEEVTWAPLRRLSDLDGKRIAVWSSASPTAAIMNEKLKLNMTLVPVDTLKPGLDMLERGEVAAVFGMGGLPIGWVEGEKAMVKASTMALLEVTAEEVGKLGPKYSNKPALYRSLNALGTNMLTVNNDLVIWNIQTGARAKAVADLLTCFKQNVDEIKDQREAHPSWVDVSVDNPHGWVPYRSEHSPAIIPRR